MAQYIKYPANSLATSPLEFIRNGVPQSVTEDTVTPANNKPLPVEPTGPNGPVTTSVVGPKVALDVNVAATTASPNVNIHDAAGNNLTSQASGGQRALDVGIDVAGVQVDPRQIRALTAADVVTADQGGAPWTVNVVQGGNTASVSAAGAVKVDGSASTQPVSGTVTAKIEDSAGNAINNGQQTMANSVPVVIASNQSAISVSATQGTSPWVENLTQVGGSAISLAQKTSANSFPVVIASDQSAVTVSGTVTSNQGTSPWVENVSQFGGSNVVTGTGASGAGIPRVTVSNDSNVLATQSGTWTVQPGNTANTTPWLTTISQGGNSATVSAGGALKVDGSASTQPVSGTVTANQGTANATPWNENVAQFGGSAVSLGSKTSANSMPVVIASDQAAVQTKAAINTTGSGSAAAATVSTVITLTAPANAVGFVLMNLDTSTANVRWSIGRTATTTLGQQLQPGRDTGFFPCGANVSLVAESGTQNYDIQWVSQ